MTTTGISLEGWIIIVEIATELGVSVFIAWMTWQMLQLKIKQRVTRRFKKLMATVGLPLN